MRTPFRIFITLVVLLLLGSFLCGVFYRTWVENHVRTGVLAELTENSIEDVDFSVDLLKVSLHRTGASGDLREARAASAEFSGAYVEGYEGSSSAVIEPSLRLSRSSRDAALHVGGKVGSSELQRELLRVFKASAGAQKIENKIRVSADANDPWWLQSIGPFLTDVFGDTNRVRMELDKSTLVLRAEAVDEKAKDNLLESAKAFLADHDLELEADVTIAPKPALLSVRREDEYVRVEGLLPSEEMKQEVISAIDIGEELVLLDFCHVSSEVESPWWKHLSYRLCQDFIQSVDGKAEMHFAREKMRFSGRLPNQAYQIRVQSLVDEFKPELVDVEYAFDIADAARLSLAMVNGRLKVDGQVSSDRERREIMRLLAAGFSAIEIENSLEVQEETAVADWLNSLPPLFGKISEVDELQFSIDGKTIELSGEVSSKDLLKELTDYLKFVASDYMESVNQLIVPPESSLRHAKKQALLKKEQKREGVAN